METKYYIAVDCEGAACAVGYPGTGLGTDEHYRRVCRQASLEAAAAARALFDAGAGEVIVWDAHGTGVNLDYERLDSRCSIVLGSGHKGRFVGLTSDFTGVLFIGYHAKEGTKDAVLAHTFSSKAFQYYKLNQKQVGELEFDAAYAGALGVPVLFCASDNLCVQEALDAFGPIATVTTKQSLSWNSALSLHPVKVCELIYETVLRAAREKTTVSPYLLPSPLEVEIRYQRMDHASRAALFDMEGNPFTFVDAYTRRGFVRSVRDL